MAQTPSSPIGTLEYAKRPRLRKRNWFRGCMLVAVVLIAAAGWRWGREVRDKAILLYHQRDCVTYAAPPEQVVFDSDPARVAILGRDPAYAVVKGCAFRKPPDHWNAYCAAVGIPVTPGNGQRAMLFLHQCRSPDGSPFIVELERTAAADESAYFLPGYDVELTVIRPATITQPAAPHSEAEAIDVLDSSLPHTDIRIYAGLPDPADASHFTIRYDEGGKTGTVDGRVDNHGHLTLTRGAAAP